MGAFESSKQEGGGRVASECGYRQSVQQTRQLWDGNGLMRGRGARPQWKQRGPEEALLGPAQTRLPSHTMPQGNGDTSHVRHWMEGWEW